MPFLTPLAAAPTGAGSDPTTYGAAHPGTVLRGPSADGVTLTLWVQNAAVGVRPYFWDPDDGSGTYPDGGRWVGIGTDSVSGAGPTTATPASYNASSHGRWQDEDSGGRHWILVVETGIVANVLAAKLTLNRRSTVTT